MSLMLGDSGSNRTQDPGVHAFFTLLSVILCIVFWIWFFRQSITDGWVIFEVVGFGIAITIACIFNIFHLSHRQ